MKVKKKIRQEYHIHKHIPYHKHIIQLFTKHKTYVKWGQMQIS